MSSSDLLRFGFTADQVERARRYHRPLYLVLAVDLGLGAVVLAVLAFTGIGDSVFGAVDGLPWWGAALAFAALAVVIPAAIRLPLGFWRGWVRERRWGLSTQPLSGWAADALKGVAVAAIFAALVEFGLVALARAWTGWWVVPAALAFAAAVLVLSFLAPIVLEPLFNRFRPLEDAALAEELRAIGRRAGVPIRDVLVADASRRTRKVNAYVSGLGRTRRVVLYDTLLERAPPPQLRLVVAHELGHRRDRHVLKGTLLAMLAAVLAVVIVWAVLGTGAADPRNAPTVLLLGLALEVASLAPGSALSRHWERAADRASLELTDDLDAFEGAHRELALANVSDLDPPRTAYLLLFSHPTPPERIAYARGLSL
jgi:STE24 endopeptidase